MRLGDDRRFRIKANPKPVILSIELTADLYHLVIVSVEPGRRMSCIVGPRGATEQQVRDAALGLVAYMNE